MSIEKWVAETVWKLTWQRVLLFAAAACVVTVAAYGWEHRETVVPGLLGNIIGVIGLAVGMFLVALALAVRWGIDFIDHKSDRMATYLREQVQMLNKKDEDQEIELAFMRRTIDSLTRNEAECRRTVNRMQRALKAAGIDEPPSSQWGVP